MGGPVIGCPSFCLFKVTPNSIYKVYFRFAIQQVESNKVELANANLGNDDPPVSPFKFRIVKGNNVLDLIWDLFQQGKINQAEHVNKLQNEKLKGCQHSIDSLSRQLRDLEKRLEQLKLVTLAMWSLLRDHSGLMESDLRKYVEKVDLLDGKKGGKIATKSERVDCSNCGRVNLNTSIVCPYSGVYSNNKPFDGA